MNVGILGLGLIGGSLARAYARDGHCVYAYDADETILSFAMLSGIVCGELSTSSLPMCDLVLLAIRPEDCVHWLTVHASAIHKDTLVIDCGGTKRVICETGFDLAEKYQFTYVGGHPMAGSHFSGFKYSRSNLFQGAPMVIVPPRFDDAELLQRVKDALAPCKFGRFSVTTADEHDRMIAFTSQMPHILSNAFIKSPTALSHKGFSAGSYKDLTRVAWLNPEMWAELFLENQEYVLQELDFYLESLNAYRDAIARQDKPQLVRLLDEGRRRKEEVDG